MIKNSTRQFFAKFIFAVSVVSTVFFTSVHAATVKESAPQRYVVKQGDTLWSISGNYLDEPWRWPELWVKNTQIENPHLIYPGDVLLLSFIDGEPVLTIEKQKQSFVLSPGEKRKDKRDAVSIVPWNLLQPYIGRSWIVPEESYAGSPKVLGNNEGSVTFANFDVLLTNQAERSDDQLYITRDKGIIRDMEGNALGVQLNHIADAEMLVDDLGSEWLVRVQNNRQEIRRGDLLWQAEEFNPEDLKLVPAENVRAHVLSGYKDNNMFGKYDVVIVDLGKDDIALGSVIGIYSKGPDILDTSTPEYVDSSDSVLPFRKDSEENNTVTQPAIKVGEAIIFSVFDNASYAFITRSKKAIRRGFIVGEP